MINFLKGKKTYFLGILGIVWAVTGWILGYLEPTAAQAILWGSLTSIAIRAGVAKTQ